MTARFEEGRCAVVTGTGVGIAGIGRAIAYRLAREGVRVLGVVRDDDEITAELLSGAGAGPPIEMIAVDLTDDDAPASVLRAIHDVLDGRIDILVNNAGGGGSAPVHELDLSRWRDMLAINLDAVFRLTKSVLPLMMSAGYGRIVNISSTKGLSGHRASSDYAVSKAGLGALTRSLAADYGAHGITANAVAPGVMVTPQVREYLATKPAWFVRESFDIKPVRRDGMVEDIASAAAFFASDEAGYITAQLLAVDGGLTRTHYVPDHLVGEAGGSPGLAGR